MTGDWRVLIHVGSVPYRSYRSSTTYRYICLRAGTTSLADYRHVQNAVPMS